ncbi:MAG: DUF2442 domain-containing protein [Verrucomicrobiota bacterium]|nr:DUF2442 domain-containing protein [Verrucomicrobiota bacterium]
MKFLNEVNNIRPLGGYQLYVSFNDGYSGEIDLWPLFADPKGPITQPFKDPEFFQKVFLDTETGVVSWPNGYDICSDVLRHYCEHGRVTSNDEMNAYFNPDISASVLNDKPSIK